MIHVSSPQNDISLSLTYCIALSYKKEKSIMNWCSLVFKKNNLMTSKWIAMENEP